MSLSSLFTDIADAIREKDGSTEEIVASTFPDRIRAISTSSKPPKWERPSDWPDYSQISLDGFEGMYFTYDMSRSDAFCSFSVTTADNSAYTVTKGYISNGEFIVQATSSVQSGTKYYQKFTYTSGDPYHVYRVTANSQIKYISMTSSDSTDGTTLPSTSQPCIERYGRLPNLNALSSWPLNSVVSETIRDVEGVPILTSTWSNCTSLISLDLSGWGVTVDRYLNSTWYSCTSLTSLDLSGWDGVKLASLTSTWTNCVSLTSLDLSGWDVSELTSLSSTWSNCYSLTSLDLSGWDVSKVTNLSSTWSNCANLISLDLSGWDVTKVTSLSSTWSNCASLTSLDLSGWDVSKVTNLNNTWYNCFNLISLDLSGWDVTKVTSLSNTWAVCFSLTFISFGIFYASTISLTSCPLAVATILDLFTKLPTVSSTHTVNIGTTNKAKLTDAQIAIATNKGWTVT